MRYFLIFFLFLVVVCGFAGLSRYTHRETVETMLTEQARLVLDEAGYEDVTVGFDYFEAVLGGVVESEEDRHTVVSLIDENVKGAYVPKVSEVEIQVRPTLSPQVSILKEKDSRVAKITGTLGIHDEEQRGLLGSRLYMVNGVDAVENELELHPKYLEFEQAGEFVALAAQLIVNSEFMELRYDESGISVSGLVETDSKKEALLNAAGALLAEIGGDLDAGSLLVKTPPLPQKEAQTTVLLNRFGLSVSGLVHDAETKEKILSALRSEDRRGIEDQLRVDGTAGQARWSANLRMLVPILLGSAAGDVEASYSDSGILLKGAVDSADNLDRIENVLAAAAQMEGGIAVASELVVAAAPGSVTHPEISMMFDEEKIVIGGQVDSEEVLRSISVSLGAIEFSKPRTVLNEVRVNERLNASEWGENLPDLLGEVVRRTTKGSFTLKEQVLQLDGTTKSPEEKQILQNLAINALPSAFEIQNLLNQGENGFPAPALPSVSDEDLAVKLKKLPVYFDTGMDSFGEEQAETVKELADTLIEGGAGRKLIVGAYSDGVGDAKANRELSKKRANELIKHLVEYGIDEENLEVKTFVEDVSDQDEAEQYKARRVEVILPETQQEEASE